MRVIIAGGGTAGHINPAIAIADTIKSNIPDSEILFVGTKNGMENKLVPKAGYDIEYINVVGLKRKITLDNITAVLKAVTAGFKCRKLIKKFNPDIVIGTGGYVSGPLVYTAASMKIPTLIHEQNVSAGMTSKMLSPHVDTVCICFEKSRDNLKDAKNIVLTGSPLRQNLFDITKTEAKSRLGINDMPLLVAFGGSLGAQKINDAMVLYIKNNDTSKCNIIFATGERDYDRVMGMLGSKIPQNVRVVKYIYNMDEVMQSADLLVCRAGAITVCELTALGKASVLIPSPNVTDNHQYFNAKALSDNGAAILIEEDKLDAKSFATSVDSLLYQSALRDEMSKKSAKMGIKNGNELIFEEIKKLVNK